MKPYLTKKNLKLFLLIIPLFILALGITAGVYLYGSFRKISVKSAIPAPKEEVVDTRDRFEKGLPYSVLVLGYGGGGHEGGKLSDTMLLVHVVPKLESIFLISLPRDLWVSLETKVGSQSYWKINAAYAIGSDDRGYTQKPTRFTGPAGGGEMAKEVVERVTGIHSDNFLAVDFAGFQKIIDVLGGIEVKVERSFEDPAYPIEEMSKDSCGLSEDELKNVATYSAEMLVNVLPCRYEKLTFSRGITHMDGVTALKYARSRHSTQDGGDFNRSQRQKQVISAVKSKVISLNFFPKIIPFISTLSSHLTLDLELKDMELLLKYKDALAGYQIHNISLSNENELKFGKSANGQSILIPKQGQDNWPSIHEWLKLSIASASASVSAQLK